jgi:hypothetical protein
MKLPHGLRALTKLRRWVIWKLERGTKVPYQGEHPRMLASTKDSETWCDWSTVVGVWDEMHGLGKKGGVGFVLTDSVWVVIDLDDCRDAVSGELTAWAQQIVAGAWKLGAYVEVSVSGTGVHIIGRGVGDAPGRKTFRMGEGQIELYRRATRYVTVSGIELGEGGDVETNIDALVDEISGMQDVRHQQHGVDTSGKSYAIYAREFAKGKGVKEVVEYVRAHPGMTKTLEFDGRRTSWNLEADVANCYRKWCAEHEGVLKVEWSKGATPRAGLADALRAVGALGVGVRFDVFHGRYVIGGFEDVRMLDDAVSLRIRTRIIERFGFDPGRGAVDDALMSLGQSNKFDPVREYLEGLRWDGVHRLDGWLTRYLGCEDTPLVRAIGRLVLVAGVRRVKVPGCKFDQIIVLEGPEGKGKSAAIRILAREAGNFSDQSILGLSDERQQERLSGVWMYEVADLKGLKYAEVDAVKALLSRQEDRARPAYGRFVQHQPRTCVLWASTNEVEYLKGTTGNRRWWTLLVGEIDLVGLERDVDQLWAEAVVGERVWKGELILGQEHWPALQKMQVEREEPDPWEETLRRVKGARHRTPFEREEERVTVEYLMGGVLGLQMTHRSAGFYRRVSALMKKLGWEARRLKIDGEVVRGYARGLTRRVRLEVAARGAEKVVRVNFAGRHIVTLKDNGDEEGDVPA